MLDSGPNEIVSHDSSDGVTDAFKRADKYTFSSGLGENLAFGDYDDSSASDVIKQLVVDDGVLT